VYFYTLGIVTYDFVISLYGELTETGQNSFLMHIYKCFMPDQLINKQKKKKWNSDNRNELPFNWEK